MALNQRQQTRLNYLQKRRPSDPQVAKLQKQANMPPQPAPAAAPASQPLVQGQALQKSYQSMQPMLQKQMPPQMQQQASGMALNKMKGGGLLPTGGQNFNSYAPMQQQAGQGEFVRNSNMMQKPMQSLVGAGAMQTTGPRPMGAPLQKGQPMMQMNQAMKPQGTF